MVRTGVVGLVRTRVVELVRTGGFRTSVARLGGQSDNTVQDPKFGV